MHEEVRIICLWFVFLTNVKQKTPFRQIKDFTPLRTKCYFTWDKKFSLLGEFYVSDLETCISNSETCIANFETYVADSETKNIPNRKNFFP